MPVGAELRRPAGEARPRPTIAPRRILDPAFADDPDKQYFADVQQYGGGADPKLGNTATGYDIIATVIVDNLTRAAAMEGLDEANMMNASEHGPVAPSRRPASTRWMDEDAYAVEDGYIAVFDPASGGYKDTGFRVTWRARPASSRSLRSARPAGPRAKTFKSAIRTIQCRIR